MHINKRGSKKLFTNKFTPSLSLFYFLIVGHTLFSKPQKMFYEDIIQMAIMFVFRLLCCWLL